MGGGAEKWVDPLRLTVVSERRHLQASHEEDGLLKGACLVVTWVLARPSAHLPGCPPTAPPLRTPSDGGIQSFGSRLPNYLTYLT